MIARPNGQTVAWLATMLGALCLGGCSLANREGPDVTCEDLDGGTENACQEGIIAYCPDGKTVKYKVCTESHKVGDETIYDADEICEASWQEPGAYRCKQTDKACYGCNPG